MGRSDGQAPSLEPMAVASAVGLGLAFFGLADWTWQATAAPVVDAGRELYVAWRLLAGDVLYADIAYDSGPLPAWISTAVFAFVGPGIRHLVIWNAALTAAVAGLLYLQVRDLGGRLAAFVATLGMFVLFAFAQHEPQGGYGWLAPSSQAAPLSVLLALLCLAALGRYRAAPRPRAAAAVGVIVGLALLTSPQASLACLAATAGGSLALAYGRRSPFSDALVHALAGFGGVLVPLLGARVLLGFSLDPAEANLAVLSGIAPLFEPARLDGVLRSALVRGLGLDAPGRQLLILAVATALWLALLMPAAIVSWRLDDRPRTRFWGGLIAFVVFAGGGLAASFNWPPADWVAWGSPLLVVTLGVILRSARSLRHARSDEDGPEVDHRSGLMAFALAALGLLSTTGLRARLFDVGATAGVLAFALAALLLVSWLPRRIERRGEAGWVLRGAAMGLLAVFAVGHLRITHSHVQARDTQLGEGVDSVLVESAQAVVLVPALEAVAAQVPADARLQVVPEGALINYLARRKAGSPHLSLVPPRLAAIGEADVLEGWIAEPPEFVLVVQRDTVALGARAFGRDYAPLLGSWIEQYYPSAARFGAVPFAGNGFGVELRKRDPSLDTSTEPAR